MAQHRVVDPSNQVALEQALFFHEHDLIGNLRRFPLIARLRLDVLALVMTLENWQAFSFAAREAMVLDRFDTLDQQATLRQVIQTEARRVLGQPLATALPTPMADFRNLAEAPPAIVAALQGFEVELTLKKWQELPELARFGLAKLTREGRENRRLGPLVDDLFFRAKASEQGDD